MTLYRAIRFNGTGALTFDGITWEGSGAANQSHNGYNATLSNTWVPAVSGDKETFLDTVIYRDGFVHTTTNVPAGDYEVYFYVNEDDGSVSYGVDINGTVFEPVLMTPAPNYWERRGPYPVKLSSTGSIVLTITGTNYPVFSGIEIHTVQRGGGTDWAEMLYDRRTNFEATGSTYVDGPSIPASKFVAGNKYLIIASMFTNLSTNTANVRARLVHGTTPTAFDDATLDYEMNNATSQHTPIQWMTVYTQPGTAELVKLQFNTSANTAHISWAEIVAIDITELTENTDYWYNEVTTDYSTTTTKTAQAAVTFTPNGSDTYLYLGDFQVPPVTNTSNYLAELHDSVAGALTNLDIEGEEVGQENRRHRMAAVRVPTAVSHTVSMRVAHETSAHSVKSSRVFVLRLNAFENFAYDNELSALQPAAYTTYTDVVSIAPTPSTDGDWFVLSYFENDVANNTDVLYTRMQANLPSIGYSADRPNYRYTTIPGVPGADGWDATDVVPNTWMTVVPLESGSANTLKLQASLQTGTSLRLVNSMIVGFSSKLATGGGGETITAPYVASGEAVYTPTATPGVATVSPALLGAPVLYTPTMQPGYVQILANFISTGEAVYTPDAELSPPGAQTITAPLVPTGEVLYTPNVGGPLSAPLIADTGGVYSPMLASGVIITLGSLLGGPTIYSPTTVPGNSTILAPLRGSAYTLYVAQLLSGMSTIQTPQIGSYEVVFTPTGNFDLDVTITMNEVVGGPTVFVPESSGGTQVVKPGVPGLFRIGLDLDGDRWVDWEGRYDINLIPAAVWFDYLPHGEVNATVTDRHEKSAYGLIVRTVEGVAADAISYTRLGTNITPAAPVQPSTNYTIVVWARSRLLNPSAMLQLFDQDGIGLATGPEQIVGSTWTKFRYVYTTPSSGVTGLQVGFARSNTAPTDYEFELTGWGIYTGVTTNDFNSGALPGQPFPSLITEDITRYVIDVSWDSGTKGDPAQLTPIDGEISIKLNNVSQDWTPRNTASPYYNKLHAHTIIEVQVDEYGTGDWRQLWTGFFSDITITTGKSGNRQAIITGRQGLEELSMLPILYAPKNNKTATEILLDVMTEAEVPADRYSWILGVSLLGINTQFPERQAVTNFDDSTYVYPVSGVGLKPDATVRSFFDELVRNEGGFAFYDRLGRPSFRTRNALVPGLYDEEE